MAETIEQMLDRIDKWANTSIDRLLPTPNWLKPVVRAWRMEINGGSHTEAEWQALCAQHGGRCLRCKRKRKLTKDHVIPVLLGGSDDIENLQPLCQPCNSSKGAREIDYR